MAVNYNDRRFAEVESEKEKALNNVNSMYNNMISNSDKFYQEQIDASKEYANVQTQNQQANTDFAIEKIEQQKEQAEKDYTKEQKASYVDYQKQSNQYGVNAESQASAGMLDTGYAESSQVSMYNQYQQRVATARETYNRAVLNYDNAIQEAKLQNNSALAEIQYNALQQQLELSLQGFQYKNNLLQTQLQMQNETEDRYYNRWQNVLSQINTENALAEQVRQYNESLAFQKQQAQQEQANWERQYAMANSNISGDSGDSGGSGGYGEKSATIIKPSSSGSTNKINRDYYFSNGYQPRYVDGKELKESGYKVWNVFNEGTSNKTATKFGKQNIWSAGGKYYVWDGSIKDYVDVTDKVKKSVNQKVNFDWGR